MWSLGSSSTETVGTFFRGIAAHELAHGSVFRTKILNKIFLYLFSLLSWWDVFDYASSHTYHHRYTLHPEGDREVLLPIKPTTGKTFLLQMFTMNVWTQRGRTLGGGGMIGTILFTIRSALGRPGVPDHSKSEWLNELHADQPDQHRRSIWWSRTQAGFPCGGHHHFDRDGPVDLAVPAYVRRVHRRLGGVPLRLAAALRPEGQRPRLSEVRALDDVDSNPRVPLLADELAPGAPHVRGRALLQPQEAVPGGRATTCRSLEPCAAPGAKC